jgi:hypothetical protein
MKIDILTITLGRELYLKRLLNSFCKLSNYQKHEVNYHIIYQGEPSKDFLEYLEFECPIYARKWPSTLKLHLNKDEPQSVGEVLKQFRNYNKEHADYLWKLDDDALLRSDNFLDHVEEIFKHVGEAVISPYPVGLINNPGGVLSKKHTVIYSEKMDAYYTLREVGHVGGFARIMPYDIFSKIKFSNSHSEDTECSTYCSVYNKPMFYLENALIVEHQESTLGQHKRYGEGYFKGRF